MKKKQIHCPYCGAKASLRPASVVYGTATKVPDSYLYVCDRYIQTGRSDELTAEIKENFNCAGDCANWTQNKEVN